MLLGLCMKTNLISLCIAIISSYKYMHSIKHIYLLILCLSISVFTKYTVLIIRGERKKTMNFRFFIFKSFVSQLQITCIHYILPIRWLSYRRFVQETASCKIRRTLLMFQPAVASYEILLSLTGQSRTVYVVVWLGEFNVPA